MAQQIINNGTTAGDGTGENLFNAFEKVNDNFTELYGMTGFQSRVDTTNTQSLTALTDNLISFTGTLEENGNLDLLDTNSKITPIGLNDIVSMDFSFTGVVPVGTNLFLSVFLKVDGNIFRATTLPIIKGVGLDDNFSVSWILPVGSSFLTNGAEIYVNPLVSMDIKNRYISVSRIGIGK